MRAVGILDKEIEDLEIIPLYTSSVLLLRVVSDRPALHLFGFKRLQLHPGLNVSEQASLRRHYNGHSEPCQRMRGRLLTRTRLRFLDIPAGSSEFGSYARSSVMEPTCFMDAASGKIMPSTCR